jgi:hypothetical protein
MLLCRIIARIVPGKLKSKGFPSQDHEGPKGFACIAPLSFTPVLDVGRWTTPHSGCFIPGTDQVPVVEEAGWATGPI